MSRARCSQARNRSCRSTCSAQRRDLRLRQFGARQLADLEPQGSHAFSFTRFAYPRSVGNRLLAQARLVDLRLR
jgi:hypothetical protein